MERVSDGSLGVTHPQIPKNINIHGQYMNVDFILGSCAMVEWLWSLANYIMVDERKAMSPIMLEAVLFLKVNNRFWDIHVVRQAMRAVQNRQTCERYGREDEWWQANGEGEDEMQGLMQD